MSPSALVDASVWSMSAAETASTVVELTRLEVPGRRAEVAGRGARRRAPGRPEVGATSTANWLAHQTQQTRPAAARIVRLGYDLDTHDLVRDALAHGDLRLDQAR